MDWHSRAVLAWRIYTRYADLCVEALEEALRRAGMRIRASRTTAPA